ncbi:MAG TPA: chromosomal replication initiator protein DnaA [Candidatus Acetothermia bacterium]|nr:MAG: chromosomal replication initiator protein DnaA [Candidatus Acetothermia bacterium]HDI11957.1 chromosomal replication initiator protein DnaA [Candidatus Acetothermia bacterium]
MGQSVGSVWEKLKRRLIEEIPPTSFVGWFSEVRPLKVTDEHLVLEVPSTFVKIGIERRFRTLIDKILSEVSSPPRKLKLVVRGDEANTFPGVVTSPRYLGNLPLNPDYTFDTFVRGKNSQFAFAAAQLVAQSPARAYNPLFIYGKVGLGKTHLLHAIGNYILSNPNSLTVVYTTSERFANELINAIGRNATDQFRSKYRNVDVLLIDDVHFLKNKEATQEELFHTFNELYGNGKQIVLSSDRPPEELHGLQDRLVSRFRWGLVADIQPPDLETRIAILREKARRQNAQVDDSVLELIATRVTTNVRDLEGALIRVIAYTELGQGPVTPEILDELVPKEISKQRLTVEVIKQEVAERYGLTVEELEGPSRRKDIAHARQVAIYLARELTSSSFPALGAAFGGRDHSTIMHAYQKLQEEMETTPLLRSEIQSLKEDLLNKYAA